MTQVQDLPPDSQSKCSWIAWFFRLYGDCSVNFRIQARLIPQCLLVLCIFTLHVSTRLGLMYLRKGHVAFVQNCVKLGGHAKPANCKLITHLVVLQQVVGQPFYWIFWTCLSFSTGLAAISSRYFRPFGEARPLQRHSSQAAKRAQRTCEAVDWALQHCPCFSYGWARVQVWSQR